MPKLIQSLSGSGHASNLRVLRVLTVAAWVASAGSCRGRMSDSPADDVHEAAEVEWPREDSERPPPSTVVFGESETRREERSSRTESSIEWRSTPVAAPPHQESPPPFAPSRACCRTCRAGKACGNTCIARERVCHAAPGCACDG